MFFGFHDAESYVKSSAEQGKMLLPNIGREDSSPVRSSPSDAVQQDVERRPDQYSEKQGERDEKRNGTCNKGGSELDASKPVLPKPSNLRRFHCSDLIRAAVELGWNKLKMRANPPVPIGGFYSSEDGVYVPPGNALIRRIASFLVSFSASKFPYRFPKLHGLFSEICSCCHRIRLVWLRGGARQLDIYPVYQTRSLQTVCQMNTRILARSRDIQKLVTDAPWCSMEDRYLFLLGWDLGSEWSADFGNSNNCGHIPSGVLRQYERGNLTPRLIVQQSTKRDPLASLP